MTKLNDELMLNLLSESGFTHMRRALILTSTIQRYVWVAYQRTSWPLHDLKQDLENVVWSVTTLRHNIKQYIQQSEQTTLY